jgi:hypothetical protein
MAKSYRLRPGLPVVACPAANRFDRAMMPFDQHRCDYPDGMCSNPSGASALLLDSPTSSGRARGRRSARSTGRFVMAGLQRPGVVLIIALVMLWASARHIMAGDLTLNAAAARILVAIRLASVDVAILLTITAGYRG